MPDVALRAQALFRAERQALYRRTDVLFAILMVVQFVGAVIAALVISPRTWIGTTSGLHPHVWAAIGIGAMLTAMPVILVIHCRGEAITRYVIAVCQLLYSALLIHLTGGRIETHFHVFGSLAFLAFYRDWRVLVPATIVIAADHIIRAVFWPQSVFGVLSSTVWRAFEHAGWVLAEDVVLAFSCIQATREMRENAENRAHLEVSKATVEREVQLRTQELNARSDELRQSEERFALAVRGSRDGLWDWDLITNRVYYAPRWKEMLGCADNEVGDSADEWFRRIASGGLAQFHAELTAQMIGRGDGFSLELEMLHADGTPRWMLCRAASTRGDDGRAIRLAGSLTDITDLKNAEERLRQMAQHDRLTGLPNRELLTDRIRAAISKTRRDPKHRFAVLFFDFDRFKVINDGLGHAIGDALLVSIAKRLTARIRAGDTAARFGGDEFVVLLDGVADEAEAMKAARRFVNDFNAPHILDGKAVVSTSSIGVAYSGLGYEDADDVIRDADAAMYRAKSNGRAQSCLFDASMHEEALSRLNLEQDLRHAIASGELELAYQPIVSLTSGEINGFEALVRWTHPHRGRMSPDQFVPLAEEVGLIIPMGEWVLREACRQVREWRKQFGEERRLQMHVNVSRKQLLHPEFVEQVRRVLREERVKPSDISLEVTESAIMDSRNGLVPVMVELRALGVDLAMDDFGTGHSSLSCLHSFPVQVLKIDRSFILNMARQREFSAVVNAIICLAHTLNLTVVAEGIETSSQLAQLQAMDCAYGQGYLFAKPADAATCTALLERGQDYRAEAA